jgi:hypothetical protein
MSDDRPTRPSRPRISIPEFATAPLSKPFALLSNTASAVDRIVRRHVEQSAEFSVASAPLTIVAARESDLVRLLVRLIADGVLMLPVPRAVDAKITLDVRRDPRDAVLVVEVRGAVSTEPAHAEVEPSVDALAYTACATLERERDGDVRRTIARIPLAVPMDVQDDQDLT